MAKDPAAGGGSAAAMASAARTVAGQQLAAGGNGPRGMPPMGGAPAGTTARNAEPGRPDPTRQPRRSPGSTRMFAAAHATGPGRIPVSGPPGPERIRQGGCWRPAGPGCCRDGHGHGWAGQPRPRTGRGQTGASRISGDTLLIAAAVLAAIVLIMGSSPGSTR